MRPNDRAGSGQGFRPENSETPGTNLNTLFIFAEFLDISSHGPHTNGWAPYAIWPPAVFIDILTQTTIFHDLVAIVWRFLCAKKTICLAKVWDFFGRNPPGDRATT